MQHRQISIHIKNVEREPKLITDFSNLSNQKWRVINDDVMGGISNSTLQINSSGNAVFLGTVSLANGGGFASVKNEEPLNLKGFDGIRLSVLGDGNRYSFRFQTGNVNQTNPWSYEHRFDTEENLWQAIDLPFDKFQAVYRGSEVTDPEPLDPESIKNFGFLISDKQEGDFRLEIEKIELI